MITLCAFSAACCSVITGFHNFSFKIWQWKQQIQVFAEYPHMASLFIKLMKNDKFYLHIWILRLWFINQELKNLVQAKYGEKFKMKSLPESLVYRNSAYLA